VKHGDISNDVAPSIVIVWENLLGLLPSPADRAKESAARRMRRWKSAVNAYTLNEVLAKHMWDLTWRANKTLDVLTYLGDDFREALEDRIDRENLPVRHVYGYSPAQLAREIAYMRDLEAIFDPDPSRRFTYGGKGRIIDPHLPDFYGAM
jgi:hypothetical protein